MREMIMRSPIGFEESPTKMGLIKTNNENYPLNEQKGRRDTRDRKDISVKNGEILVEEV